MKLVSVKCPECGAELQIEEGRQQAFCTYCGSKILLQNENEYVFRQIDEARIVESENDRIVRMRELELEDRTQTQKNQTRKILTYLWFASIVIVAVIAIIAGITSELGYLSSMNIIFYIGGPVVGGGAYLLFKWIPEKEAEKLLLKNGSGVRFPELPGTADNRNYEAVREALTNAGFTKIRCINMHDIKIGILGTQNKVQSITINGSDSPTSGKIYDRQSPIIITYHGK